MNAEVEFLVQIPAVLCAEEGCRVLKRKSRKVLALPFCGRAQVQTGIITDVAMVVYRPIDLAISIFVKICLNLQNGDRRPVFAAVRSTDTDPQILLLDTIFLGEAQKSFAPD